MTKAEQANLVELARTLEERAASADREYKVHHDQFRRAFCDGQAHAFGRAASDLWDVLGGLPANEGER